MTTAPVIARTAYDAANPWAPIPPDAGIVEGYIDGLYQSYAELAIRYPTAEHVSITVLGAAGADVADGENGDLTPAELAQWGVRELANPNRRRPPTLYHEVSWHITVINELGALGHAFADPANWPAPGIYSYEAGYTNYPYLPAGDVACQYQGGITAPYDLSDTNGRWPYNPVPGAPTPPGAGLTNCVGGGRTPDGKGYWLVQADGGVFTHGDAPFDGSEGGVPLSAPIVAVAAHPTRYGYWLAASDGKVFAFGAAVNHGSPAGPLNKPIVGITPTASGNGYWLVASDGGVFTFGDAAFHGSTGNLTLTKPVVALAADPTSGGYALIASDGGVFAFDTPFHGSLGNVKLNAPVVGGGENPGGGYRLVASDGGVFCFGAAGYYGSTGNIKLAQPVVGMIPTSTGKGYWLVARDGGVFTFGDAPFEGSGA